jgi:hypothetical protein
MPSTPYALLRVSLNGGPARTGGIEDASVGDMCQFSVENTSGINHYKWVLFDFPPNFPCPVGWEVAPDGKSYFTLDAIPAAFELSLWGKYLPQLFIEEAWKAARPAKFVDMGKTAISVASPLLNLRDISFYEGQEFSLRGWPEDFRENLRQIEGAGGTGGGGGSVGIEPAPTNIYVNGTTGNDSNDGSISSPLATITKAMFLVGDTVRVATTIWLTGPSLLSSGYDMSAFRKQRVYLAELAIRSASTQFTVMATGTVVSSTFLTVTAGGGWTEDAFKGALIRVLTGPSTGAVRRILSNTTSTLTLLDGFETANLLAGATFEIFHQSIVLDFQGTFYWAATPYHNRVRFFDVEVSLTQSDWYGYVSLTNVTARTGTTNKINVWGGGVRCSLDTGFAWRKVGSAVVGTIELSGCDIGIWCGILGFLNGNNCGGQGHGGAVTIRAGEAALEFTFGCFSFYTAPFYQGLSPVLYLTDYGNSSKYPLRISGGNCENFATLAVLGSGSQAGVIILRERAHFEHAIPIDSCEQINMSHGCTFRIAGAALASGGGNIPLWSVDGKTNSYMFNANDVIEGKEGSRVWRDDGAAQNLGDFYSGSHALNVAPLASTHDATLANAATLTADYLPLVNNSLIRITWAVRVGDLVVDYFTLAKRDGAGVVTLKTGKYIVAPSDYSAPPAVTVSAAAVTNDRIRLSVLNSTGGALKVRIAPAIWVETD